MDTIKTSGASPLRYPGGKASLSQFLHEIITRNYLEGGVYYELYAGGSGAALSLLFSNVVSRIVINDADYHIYAFWRSILSETVHFIERIQSVPVTVHEWRQQRIIYDFPERFSLFEVGFATFFLNRCNRSGILTKAGPIGGYDQTGNYKIDARFNKEEMIRRLRKIAECKNQIDVYNDDAIAFLKNHPIHRRSFVYLDPPYFCKGRDLYLNYYNYQDHVELSTTLSNLGHIKWLVSYDYASEIMEIFKNYPQSSYQIHYSLNENRPSNELLIFSPSLSIPDTMQIYGRRTPLNIINNGLSYALRTS